VRGRKKPLTLLLEKHRKGRSYPYPKYIRTVRLMKQSNEADAAKTSDHGI